MMLSIPQKSTAALVLTVVALGGTPTQALAPATSAHHTTTNNNINHDHNLLNLNHNLVETRKDPFGGTGLYATAPIRQGQAFFGLNEQQIVFGAPDNTPISDCIDFLTGGDSKNGITDSLSIGASLASWRLFQDENAETVVRDVGVSPASEQHAESLPWEKARWQLPILWSEEVLDQALDYGIDQVVLQSSIAHHHQQTPPTEQQHYNGQSQQHQALTQYSDEESSSAQEIQQACQEAKDRVVNFKVAAARLAQELGPSLSKTYGISSTPDKVSLACHQAMALVFSRTFLHRGEITMLPTIDSANHNAAPNAKLQNDEQTAGNVLVAQQDIAPGEEITISYGLEESGNILSFSGYGFIPHGMAEESGAGKALQLAAIKGQEIAKEQLVMMEQQQQQHALHY